MQRAAVKSVQFVIWAGVERAIGVCVSHPKIQTGHELLTSRVVRKFKNGNFVTRNTRYTVVKAS